MAQLQFVGNRFLRAKSTSVLFCWISAIVVSSICSYQLGYNDSNPMEMKVNQKEEEEEEEVTTAPTPAAVDISNIDFLTKGEDVFFSTAKSLSPVTDKVTTHSYQIMYGRFLLPYYQQNPSMKMLEIGLGCNMNYGPGASVAVWKELFPEAELWEAEFDAECAEKHKDVRLNVLTGDQGDDAVLDSWVQSSGGNFDVVIDDGGHQNCQIWHSFLKLWPTVKPGGLYFIEDLQVGRWPEYRGATTDKCSKDLIVMEKLKEYMDVLIHQDQKTKEFAESDIEFIFCQHEACVLGKKK